MENEIKFINIDINLIKDILVLKQIEHTINKLEAKTFNLLVINEPNNFMVDEETQQIIAINPMADIYIAQKIDEENDQYSIDELITNELELDGITYAKYDIINFDLSGVTCKGMILDFNSNDAFLFIETLVNSDNGLTVLNIPFNAESKLEIISRMDDTLIDAVIDAIDNPIEAEDEE